SGEVGARAHILEHRFPLMGLQVEASPPRGIESRKRAARFRTVPHSVSCVKNGFSSARRGPQRADESQNLMRFNPISPLALCIVLGCNSDPGGEDNDTDSIAPSSSTTWHDTTTSSTGSSTTSLDAKDAGSSSSAEDTEGSPTLAEDSGSASTSSATSE